MTENSKYKNGKIYKIISLSNPEKVYYGSTCQTLAKRFYKHKKDFEYQNFYVSSFIVLACGDAEIVLVENCPCNSKEELRKKEMEYILNNVCVNKVIPTRKFPQYYQDNKESIIANAKEYVAKNREKTLEYQKNYANQNKEKKSKYDQLYREKNKEHIQEYTKSYYENNSEKVKTRANEYRKNNKDKISQRISEKISCECGSVVTRGKMSRHLKSKKHQTLLTQKPTDQSVLFEI